MANLQTLVSFSGVDGSAPRSTLVADSDGNLFGTTDGGGASGAGTVFEVLRSATGYAATPTILASFSGADQSGPTAGVVMDASGDLFGVAPTGGANGTGYAFEIVHTQAGYAAAPTVLVNFDASAGTGSKSGLVLDASGNLFGTTQTGGSAGDGSIYEIARVGGGYASLAITLASFTGPNGRSSNPLANLIVDAGGNLFGTTFGGGNDRGTVFELAKTATGYAATPTVLATLDGGNPSTPYGAYPEAPVVMDAAGNLFGTAFYGGYGGNGTVFEIAKTGGSYATTPIVLATFGPNSGGSSPEAGLIIDGNGDLFGTTYEGGATGGYGTVFEIAHTGAAYASVPTFLASFDGSPNAHPNAALLADGSGNLFGTTEGLNISESEGSVFALTDTDYVACYARGTLIATPGGEVAVEDLAIGDRVLTAAGLAEPVRWIGRRSYAGRFLAGRRHLLPILFRAGSLGAGLPRRDLRVSPAHAMFLHGVLMPASCLVNGVSIFRDEACQQIDYLHVELARHDVILAEGAPSETFLDDDSRGLFHNAAEYRALYPDLHAAGRYCAPRVEDGYVLDAIRQRLDAIARDLTPDTLAMAG